MTTSLLIAMTLLLIAALERTNRRQAPKAPGLNGSYDRDDRDWARTQHDLIALSSQAEPSSPTKPVAIKAGSTSTDGSRSTSQPQRTHWETSNRNGPHAA